MAKAFISYAWSLHTEGSDDGDASMPPPRIAAPSAVSVSLLRHCLRTSNKEICSTFSFPLGVREAIDGRPLPSVVLPPYGHVTVCSTTALLEANGLAPSGFREDGDMATVEWLLLVEHWIEAGDARAGGRKVELARHVLEPTAAVAHAAVPAASHQAWQGGYLLPLDTTHEREAGALEMLFVASVLTGPKDISHHQQLEQQGVANAYITAFKRCVAQPRWQVVKAQFTTAIDDILLLEEKVEEVIRQKDEALEAAQDRQQQQQQEKEKKARSQENVSPDTGSTTPAPLHLKEQPSESERTKADTPPPAASTGQDQGAPMFEATDGGAGYATPSSPHREAKALRQVIQAKDSEMFILRARIQAMEEARKAELEHLRQQLSRLKLKRVDLADRQQHPRSTSSKKGTHGGHPSTGAVADTPPSTTIPTAATQQRGTSASKRGHDSSPPAGGAPPSPLVEEPGNTTAGARGGSRQASPSARLPTPQRRHARQVSDYSKLATPSAPTAADGGSRGGHAAAAGAAGPVAGTTAQLDEDRKQRLQRLEESFAKLQSRHYAARTAAGTSIYSVTPPVAPPGGPPPVAAATSRTQSPLRVPDSIAALRGASPSAARKQLPQQQQDPNSGGESPQQTHVDPVGRTSLSLGRSPAVGGSGPRASSPLLRISPGTFRAVLDPAEKKPPMHRR